MIVSDAVNHMKKLGAKRYGRKRLEDPHGTYAVEMFSSDFQNFFCIGAIPENRTLLIQKALFPVADIRGNPIIAVLFDRKPPGVKIFIADEVLTKHREDSENLLGVVSIRFPLSLGKDIETINELKKEWRKLRIDWNQRKKNYKSKTIQKKMTQFKKSMDSSTLNQTVW